MKWITIRKLGLSGFLTGLILGSLILLANVIFNDPARAGAISNLSISVADKTKSTSTSYTVTLKNATKIPKDGGRIHLRVYGPWSDTNFNSVTLDSASSTSGISIYSYNWDGITFYTTSDIAANTTITLKLNSVKNPSKGGYYFGQVWTTQYYSVLDGTNNWGGDQRSSYWEIGTNTNLVGTVSDSNGAAVPFAQVSINNSGYSQNSYTYTDASGRWGIGDVLADTYTFRVYSPPNYDTGIYYFSPPDASITIPASGQTTKNTSFLATPKTISGKITKDTLTGAAVTDATVSVYRIGSSGWAQTKTDSSGNYTLRLPGGNWSTSVYNSNYPSDWVMPWDSNGNEVLSFADDSTTQSLTKNFVVRSLSVTLKGTIKRPDGTAVPRYGASINFSGSASWPDPADSTKTKTGNFYFYASLNGDDGTFSTKAAPGTYSVSGWSSESSFSFPKIDNFSVSDNDTKEFTITLSEKKDSISGSVKDNFGAAVSGINVYGWSNDNGNYEYSNATTDTSGNYSLKVIPGSWQVSAYPGWKEGGSDYVYTGKPTAITVKSGVPATVNFVFQKTTAMINGLVTDPDGKTLSSLSAWASASDGSEKWGNVGSQVTNGVFRLRMPAGKWTVNVNLYGGDYGSPEPEVVELKDNETKSITMKATKNDAKIYGTIYDDKGEKVTNKWLSIYASKGKGNSWQSASLDQAKATYEIQLSAGTWSIGYWVDSQTGYSSDNAGAEVTVKSKEEVKYDINLKKVTATIKGKATKPDGTALRWVWITADSRSPDEKTTTSNKYYANGASTDASGNYTLKVPAGTYWIGGNYWSGYINPKRQKVTVEDNKEATVDLVFRSPDSKITGTVRLKGDGTNAYVYATSEDGASADGNASNSGTYELSVSSGTKWHLTAVRQDDKKVYKTEKEAIVDLTNATQASQDLELVEQKYTLPDKKSTSFKANQPTTIEVGSEVKITVPAAAITKTNDDLTATVAAKADIPTGSGVNKPVKYAYDITFTKTDGTEIKAFSSTITIQVNYSDQSDAKFDKSELTLASFKDDSGIWQPENCVKTNADVGTTTFDVSSATTVTVTCSLTHATLFALVAPIDNIPPSAPTEVQATSGDKKVTLSWKNPTEADFKDVAIYRSTVVGQLGSKVVSNQTGLTFEDTAVTNGTTYYYTVRANDKSGNESANTNQTSATPSELAASTSTDGTATGSGVLPKAGADLPASRQKTTSLWYLFSLMPIGAGLIIARRSFSQFRLKRTQGNMAG